MRSRTFLLFYSIILITAIVSQFYFWEVKWLHFISKPLIMTSLLGYVLSRTAGSTGKILLILAILFSLLGDVLLMIPVGEVFFIGGLAAFLTAHLLYCWLFVRKNVKINSLPFIRRHPWFVFLTGLFAYYMWSQMRDGAFHMLLPVTIYILVISIMAILAMNRQNKVGTKSFQWVAIGAILFVMSDSFLGWNRFVEELPYSPVLILVTYGLAQLLIVSGMVEQFEDRLNSQSA